MATAPKRMGIVRPTHPGIEERGGMEKTGKRYRKFTVTGPRKPNSASVAEKAASIFPLRIRRALAARGPLVRTDTFPPFSETERTSEKNSPAHSASRTFRKQEERTAETATGLDRTDLRSTFFTKAIPSR